MYYIYYIYRILSDVEDREACRLVIIADNISSVVKMLSGVYEHVIQSLGFIILLYI